MAKEYIPRADVINDIGELFTICRETYPNECGHHFIVEDELQIHLDYVRNLPAADVVEVRHGRWMKDCDRVMGDGWTYTQRHCSECGGQTVECVNYCQFCGAKMDGGQDDV